MKSFVAAVGLLCSVAPTQELLWQRTGIADELWVGDARFLDDLNGDGYEDLACMAVRWLAATSSLLHVTLFLSGRDGSTLREAPISSTLYSYLTLAVAGDMDGDGTKDYARTRQIRSATLPAVVDVMSGADDSVLWTASNGGPLSSIFGYHVVGDLDLNGDQMPDLLITAYRESPSGAVYGFDHTGTQLFRVPGPSLVTSFPFSIAKVGDVDADGCDDFVVGTHEPSYRGVMHVYSGRTQGILVSGYGEQPFDGIGTGTAVGCGDVDGDGVPDFAASSEGGGGWAAVVMVFSGRTGSSIYTWRQFPGSSYGRVLAAGELDLDGVEDLLVYAPPRPPRIWADLEWRSLRNGSVVSVFGAPTQPVPVSWADIGRPQPGHPFPVLLVGEETFGYGRYANPGRVNLFRGAPRGVTGLGSSCTGTLSAAPQMGLTNRGEAGVRLHLSGAPAGSPSLLLLGLSSTTWSGTPLPLSLGFLGFSGCTLQTSVELSLPIVTGTTGINAGYAKLDLPLALAPGVPQFTLHGQWLVFGSGAAAPGALSGGLSWGH